MEIRVLRYFLTVVREESITRAAQVLHITQPTLSRQLSQLEEQMGVKLFIRGTRKISLTNEGFCSDAERRRSWNWSIRQSGNLLRRKSRWRVLYRSDAGT